MAKRPRQIIQEPVNYGDFIIVNREKLSRVIEGYIGRGGAQVSGLGKNATPEQVLPMYDKLGGLILTKDGRNVATGTFWDFENKCPKSFEENEKPTSDTVATEDSQINKGGLKVNEVHVGDNVKPRRGRKPKMVEEE